MALHHTTIILTHCHHQSADCQSGPTTNSVQCLLYMYTTSERFRHCGTIMYLERGVLWVRIPPRAVFSLKKEKAVLGVYIFALLCLSCTCMYGKTPAAFTVHMYSIYNSS